MSGWNDSKFPGDSCSDPPFLPLVIHRDEGDMGGENRRGVGVLFVGDLDLVGDRGVSLP